MQHKKLVLALFLVFFLITTSVFSYEEGSNWPKGYRLEVTEYADPVIPLLSALKLQIPSELFISDGILSNFNFSIWYLSYSPYFWPAPFFESGLLVEYFLINGQKLGIAGGLGTAFSMADGVVSIPIIGNIKFLYSPIDLLQLEVLIQANGYENSSFILDNYFKAFVKPFRSKKLENIFFGLGIGLPLLIDSNNDQFAFSLLTSFNLGYVWEGK